MNDQTLDDRARLVEAVATAVDQELKERSGNPRLSFALMVFEAGDETGRMDYISSAPRENMFAAIRTFIGRQTGGYVSGGRSLH